MTYNKGYRGNEPKVLNQGTFLQSLELLGRPDCVDPINPQIIGSFGRSKSRTDAREVGTVSGFL